MKSSLGGLPNICLNPFVFFLLLFVVLVYILTQRYTLEDLEDSVIGCFYYYFCR